MYNTGCARCACAQREYHKPHRENIINRWRCYSYRYPPLHLSLSTQVTRLNATQPQLVLSLCRVLVVFHISHRRHAHDGTPSLSLSLSRHTSPLPCAPSTHLMCVCGWARRGRVVRSTRRLRAGRRPECVRTRLLSVHFQTEASCLHPAVYFQTKASSGFSQLSSNVRIDVAPTMMSAVFLRRLKTFCCT